MTVIERLTVMSNSGLPQHQLDTVMAAIRHIESLQRQVRAADRDANDAATEARWMERNERDGVPYGTY